MFVTKDNYSVSFFAGGFVRQGKRASVREKESIEADVMDARQVKGKVAHMEGSDREIAHHL